MPARATRYGAQPVISVPAKRTRPPLGGTRPMIAFSVVLRPEPLRPSRAATSPSATSRSMPWRAMLLP